MFDGEIREVEEERWRIVNGGEEEDVGKKGRKNDRD